MFAGDAGSNGLAFEPVIGGMVRVVTANVTSRHYEGGRP